MHSLTVKTVAPERLPGGSDYIRLIRDNPALCRELTGVADWSGPALLENLPHRGGVPRLMDDLRRQNADPDPAEAAALKRAAGGQAIFVITGQQAGLFTGPLYTIYKAVTVLRLVRFLRQADVDAVGLFWVAGEDHDIDEVAAVHLDRGLQPPVRLAIEQRPAEPLPVSTIRLGDEIGALLDEVARVLPGGAAADTLGTWLAECYRPEATFGEAFHGLMRRLFAGTGLLFFDPMAADREAMMRDFVAPLPRLRDEIHDRLARSDERMRSLGLEPQVPFQSERCCLFYLHPEQGRRRLLETPAGDLRVDGTSAVWDRTAWEDELNRHPGRFSADALLRPVLQDFLFPTAVYVGGQAELAYQAQIRELYPLWGLTPPVLWPRAGATVIGPALVRKLERLEITAEDLFRHPETVLNEIFARQGEREALDRFQAGRGEVEDSLERLGAPLAGFPEPMVRSADSTLGKIRGLLDKLEDRLRRQVKKDNEDTVTLLEVLRGNVLPGGNLQERTMNLLPVLALVGPGFMDWILETLDPFSREHVLLLIEESIPPADSTD